MCLMLFLATNGQQPLRTSPELSVEEVEPAREVVHQWFRLPTVRSIIGHGSCACAFPCVSAEEPVVYFEGMLDAAESREAGLRSVRTLVDLVREHVAETGGVELFAVWNGEEGLPPKGTIELAIAAIHPETFFFNERFLYRITRDPP